MARKLNPQGLIEQNNYLFADHAQFKDLVFKKFQEVAAKHQMPIICTEEKFKAGGLFGSSDIMLSIEAKGDVVTGIAPFAALGVTTFGKYLSVNLYFLVEDTFWNKVASGQTGLVALATSGKDMISVRNTTAFWNTVVACVEESFNELKFEEVKKGFLGIK